MNNETNSDDTMPQNKAQALDETLLSFDDAMIDDDDRFPNFTYINIALITLTIFILLIVMLIILFPSAVSAQIVSELRITPNLAQGGLDETIVTTVEVTNISDLAALDIEITYDPTIITVIDMDEDQEGTQITLGSTLQSKRFFMAVNQVEEGYIKLAGALIAPETTVSGDGVLLEISWQPQQTGQTSLDFNKAILVNTANETLSVETISGQINIGSPITLIGQVERQGVTDHRGITVISTEAQVESGPEGEFSITGFTPYQLTFKTTNYLSTIVAGQAKSTELNTVDVGTIVLLAGDVTKDDKIDIFDISLVGSRYGTVNTQADLNQDGQVDIFDLALAGANYGTEGPIMITR